MALSAHQQKILDYQIQLVKDEGFFLPDKCPLYGNTRYLIISSGGIGAYALREVKKLFKQRLSAQDLETRVRFLAVDSDERTKRNLKHICFPDGLTHTVEDELPDSEFFYLSPRESRHALLTPQDLFLSQWLNPQLTDWCQQDVRLIRDTGGTRQFGRLLLYPADTAYSLSRKISMLVHELTDGNFHDLKIFILAGISGGTGSGTLVDLTYLVRDSISFLPPTRVQYGGFILLPSVGMSCNPHSIQHGNTNGYAALKEINHFMTLQYQQDRRYSFTYSDGHQVVSGENLFDACYLFEGSSNSTNFRDPRDAACRVLANSLLNMVTSHHPQLSRALPLSAIMLEDANTFSIGMVAGNSVHRAVRDADYIYGALGHHEFALPSHEIKAFLGHLFMKKIYAHFRKCWSACEDDARHFVEAVIRRRVTTESQIWKAMNEEISVYSRDRKYGPLFVADLLDLVPCEIDVLKAKLPLIRPCLVSDEVLEVIRFCAHRYSSTVCAGHLAVIEQLKELAALQHDPADLFPTVTQNPQTLIQYLTSLVSSSKLNYVYDELLDEMFHNREVWGGLASDNPTMLSKAISAMRKFWDHHISYLINSGFEDLLIKLYSNDPNACFDRNNPQASQTALNLAAQAIYHKLVPNVEPMVRLSNHGLSVENFICHTFLTVPESAPHLYQELSAYAQTQHHGVTVCTGTESDRVSCCKLYRGIPAFMLRWVPEAESVYEDRLQTEAGIGLHLSEAAAGESMRNLPNLLPRSAWPLLGTPYENQRENRLADHARRLFMDACAMRVALPSIGFHGTVRYSALILPEAFRPDDALYRALASETLHPAKQQELTAAVNAAAGECAERLFRMLSTREALENLPLALVDAGIAFDRKSLYFSNQVITPAPTDALDPAVWAQELAAMNLRRQPDTMRSLEATLHVLKLLREKIEEN